MNTDVSVRTLRATLPMEEFARRFRLNIPVEQLCGACPNYGRRWACPPLSPADCITHYSTIEVWVVQITPAQPDLPLSEAHTIINAQRAVVEPLMLAREAELHGRAALFTGLCPHCPHQQCARIAGEPCRHPELVRPSLEALGFNLGEVTRELFNIDMLWGRHGRLPQYLTLVGAVCY